MNEKETLRKNHAPLTQAPQSNLSRPTRPFVRDVNPTPQLYIEEAATPEAETLVGTSVTHQGTFQLKKPRKKKKAKAGTKKMTWPEFQEWAKTLGPSTMPLIDAQAEMQNHIVSILSNGPNFKPYRRGEWSRNTQYYDTGHNINIRGSRHRFILDHHPGLSLARSSPGSCWVAGTRNYPETWELKPQDDTNIYNLHRKLKEYLQSLDT